MGQSQSHSVFGEQRQEQEPRPLAVCCSWILRKTAGPQYSLQGTMAGSFSDWIFPLVYFRSVSPLYFFKCLTEPHQEEQPVFKERAVFHPKWTFSQTLLCGGGELCFLPMDNSNTYRNWLGKCKTSGAITIEMPWLSAYKEWFMDPLHVQVGCPSCTWKTKQSLAEWNPKNFGWF